MFATETQCVHYEAESELCIHYTLQLTPKPRRCYKNVLKMPRAFLYTHNVNKTWKQVQGLHFCKTVTEKHDCFAVTQPFPVIQFLAHKTTETFSNAESVLLHQRIYTVSVRNKYVNCLTYTIAIIVRTETPPPIVFLHSYKKKTNYMH